MKATNQNNKSDFIIGEYFDNDNVNNPVIRKIAILKSDIIRVWEKSSTVIIYLKSKCNDSQHYIEIQKTNIFEQL